MSSRLRSSCNACHDAKIKCVKAKTSSNACTRCDAVGQACRYSPSLPRVYRKRRKISFPDPTATSPNTIEPETVAVERCPGTNNLALLPSPPSENFQSPPSDNLQNPSIGNGVDFFLSDLPSSPDASRHRTEAPWMTTCVAKAGQWPGFSPRSHYEAFSEILMSETIFEELTAGDNGSTPDSDSSYAAWPRDPLQLDVRAMRDQVRWVEDLLPGTLEAQHKPQTPRVRRSGPCDCLNLLQLAMQRLTPNIEAPALAIDSVLATNRNVVEKCRSMLHCACRSNELGILAMICGLLDLVLTSYSSAFDAFVANLHVSGVNKVDFGDGRERERQPTSVVKLSLGSFDLDKHDQILYVSKVVQREIRKVEDALQRLSEQTSGQVIQSLTGALKAHLLQRCRIIETGFQDLETSSDPCLDVPNG